MDRIDFTATATSQERPPVVNAEVYVVMKVERIKQTFNYAALI